MSNEHLDEVDRAILVARVIQRDAVEGPRVGDYVRFETGRLARITYLWPCDAQITALRGSWYLDAGGYVDFSGPLSSPVQPAVPIGELQPDDEIRAGEFDFFHHDEHRPNNSVHVMVPCRVYRRVERKSEER